MTRPTMRMGNVRAAVAVLAVLYAIAALAVLATATISGDRSAPDRTVAASPLEPSPLGR